MTKPYSKFTVIQRDLRQKRERKRVHEARRASKKQKRQELKQDTSAAYQEYLDEQAETYREIMDILGGFELDFELLDDEFN